MSETEEEPEDEPSAHVARHTARQAREAERARRFAGVYILILFGALMPLLLLGALWLTGDAARRATAEAWLLPGAGALIGGVLLFGLVQWYLSPRQRARRALRRAPVCSVAGVREGEVVKIVGTLKLGPKTLSAPFSARECAYYEVIAEEWYRRRETEGWRECVRETDLRSFYVEDETGRAWVDTERARTLVRAATHAKSEPGEESEPRVEAFLRRYGHRAPKTVRVGGRTEVLAQPPRPAMRFREGSLGAGDPVVVLGRARWEGGPAGEGGYRAPSRRLVIEALPEGELVIGTEA